jgi:hypothetical protein
MVLFLSSILSSSLGGILLIGTATGDTTPKELGRVQWQRDFDGVLSAARESSKPVFVLFQEVPGCQTCVSFGEQVLSNPLLVEAIDTEFIPVFVYNNRLGQDAEILQRYEEPSWNNPVVRFLKPDGTDIIPREAGVWTPYAIGLRMITALERIEKPVPAYLRAAVDELRPHVVRQATFGMYCFWSGEACLGRIPGLLGSRVGFLDGHEVVEIEYDPNELPYATLVQEAHARGCADSVFVQDAKEERIARSVFGNRDQLSQAVFRLAPKTDEKHALQYTDLKSVALTPRQALQSNAIVATGASSQALLSPRQQAQAGLTSPKIHSAQNAALGRE